MFFPQKGVDLINSFLCIMCTMMTQNKYFVKVKIKGIWVLELAAGTLTFRHFLKITCLDFSVDHKSGLFKKTKSFF